MKHFFEKHTSLDQGVPCLHLLPPKILVKKTPIALVVAAFFHKQHTLASFALYAVPITNVRLS